MYEGRVYTGGRVKYLRKGKKNEEGMTEDQFILKGRQDKVG